MTTERTWTITELRTLNRQFVEAGFQCPECSGVRIETRQSKLDSSPDGFLCVECGCQFGARR